MGLINFINQRPPLEPGEHILWQRPCGYSLDTAVVAGTIFKTESDLIFMPNRMSNRKSWGPQRIRLADVSRVDVMGRTGTPYNGGLRRRVRVEMHNGAAHLLVMKHPDKRAAELRSFIAGQAHLRSRS
jgi:hypothetical protein